MHHAADEVAETQGGCRILVVEDDEAVGRVISRALSRFGYVVCLARDGDEAVQLVEAHGPTLSLVISDVVLPGVSGEALCKVIRERHPRLPVLLMSGYPEDSLSTRGVHAAGAEFLHKPFSPDTLTNRVRQLVEALPAS